MVIVKAALVIGDPRNRKLYWFHLDINRDGILILIAYAKILDKVLLTPQQFGMSHLDHGLMHDNDAQRKTKATDSLSIEVKARSCGTNLFF